MFCVYKIFQLKKKMVMVFWVFDPLSQGFDEKGLKSLGVPKLTRSDKIDIINALARGERSADLAKAYNVSQSTINRTRQEPKPKKPRKLKPCGTNAAYMRHSRAGERCTKCWAAHAEDVARYKKRESMTRQQEYGINRHPLFPDYWIHDTGTITRRFDNIVVGRRLNSFGFPMVNLVDRSGFRRTRQVNRLVAELFSPPPLQTTFDTPVHLNGDKQDCLYTNLEWRPRWFALAYHRQFEERPYTNDDFTLTDSEGWNYDNIWDAVVELGVLRNEILEKMNTELNVFPTELSFRSFSITK